MNEYDFNRYVRLISLMGSKLSQGVILRQGSRLNPCSIALVMPLVSSVLADHSTPDKTITHVAECLLKNAEEGPAFLSLKDAGGQSRPYYGLLACALVFHAYRLSPSNDVRIKRQLRYLNEMLELLIGAPAAETDPAFFTSICYAIGSGIQAGFGLRDAESLVSRITARITPSGWICETGDMDAQPDVQVYRELVSLHALYGVGRLLQNPALIARAYQVADMHMEFTQPDYFTSQPWAVACFLSRHSTITMGETQLNDCSVSTSDQALLPGHPPGAINALILADAWVTLHEKPV